MRTIFMSPRPMAPGITAAHGKYRPDGRAPPETLDSDTRGRGLFPGRCPTAFGLPILGLPVRVLLDVEIHG